jgi:antitoxin PrlF
MRRRLGVDRAAQQVVAEETDEGILLRPGVTFPVELYSEKRLAEFRRHNEDALANDRFKKK